MPDEYIKDVKREEDLTLDIAAKDRLLVGSPAEWREQLQPFLEELRPDYLLLRLRHPGGLRTTKW